MVAIGHNADLIFFLEKNQAEIFDQVISNHKRTKTFGAQNSILWIVRFVRARTMSDYDHHSTRILMTNYQRYCEATQPK